MRAFILSLSAKSQFFVIVFSTIIIAFLCALFIQYCFGSLELLSKTGLITSIYAVLGTIYAVLVAFSVTGVWQNYCAAEVAVISEVSALADLVHMVSTSITEKSQIIRDIATDYVKLVISEEWPALAKGDNQMIVMPHAKTFNSGLRLVKEIQSIQPVDARDNVIFSHVLTLLTRWLDARRTRVLISKGNTAHSLWPMLIAGAFILFAFHGLFVAESYLLWATLLLGFSGIIGLSFYLIFTLDSPYAGSPSIDARPFVFALTWLKDDTFSVEQ